MGQLDFHSAAVSIGKESQIVTEGASGDEMTHCLIAPVYAAFQSVIWDFSSGVVPQDGNKHPEWCANRNSP